MAGEIARTPGGAAVPNRLASSTSPYLLQHKDNPVDWQEWGDEAFAEARERDVPVLLSVGYAACHWCHVMAHESFEDPDTAALMNEGFVNIKVDREERPDVDAVYMEAVQAMTGQGGWPMTAILTPDGQPFYAGTYFPPRPRQGMPSFSQVLTAVSQTWQTRRGDVLTAAADITARLADHGQLSPAPGEGPPTTDDLEAAVGELARMFDPVHAGFGGAPKFPPSMVLEFLLRHHGRTGSSQALQMAAQTCAAMARGGMYDQLGGGFARYSVDEAWVVPHFEKMLYDNALLLRVYVHWWRSTGDPLAERVVGETAEFLLRDMRTAEGGFASALDADTGGVEGSTYVWTPAQLIEVLGESDGRWAAQLLDVTGAGTFEHGRSVLQLRADPDDWARWAGVRRLLFEARSDRPQPGRDDKVVAAWNGLAIAALAEAGAVFERPEWVRAAERAGDLLLRLHLGADGRTDRVVRVSRDGGAGRHAGVLEDQADVAEGLLTLYAVTADTRWLTTAGLLVDGVLDNFRDAAGSFYDTAADAEVLLRRPQDPTDNATPSGPAAAAGVLLTFAAYTGLSRYREAAESALAVYAPLARRYPRFAGWGLAVSEAAVDGPREVAVVGEPDAADWQELRRVAWLGTAPGLVVALGTGAADDPSAAALLAGRRPVGGRAAAYVCRGFVCDVPRTDPGQLAVAIGSRS
jgi:uncharacterized protein YyaL (SSP411 family)